MRKLSQVERLAYEWARQRQKYMRAESLGKASSRAALFRKAEKLQRAAIDLKRFR